MYPSEPAHRLTNLLRISRVVDIVGDVSATVDHPADLLAWADILPDPTICAWRAHSGHRYLQVTSPYHHAPVHGRVAAVLPCDRHEQFWNELPQATDLGAGDEKLLTPKDLAAAWAAMPLAVEGGTSP
jgi:hypothetical protein